MANDPWLQRWLPRIAAQVANRAVFEIGCGDGRDTEFLTAAGLAVVAIDLSPEAVAQAASRAPNGEFHCQDLRSPFPSSAVPANVILASLSLHYFPWKETLDIVGRIHQVLLPSGLLLCRLNATDDYHFGASGYPMIEPNYYLVEGQPKRFFGEADVRALFADRWNILHLEHHIVSRYAAKPKALWETVLERIGSAPACSAAG